MKNKTLVLSLSGGLDSTTLLYHYLNKSFNKIYCLNFQYGSKHNSYEFDAFDNVVRKVREDFQNKIEIYTHVFDLTSIFKQFSSHLLLSGGEIPEGHYNDENMKKTVVPGRNTIFLSVMMGFAQSIGATHIALGVHKGDHHIYPDCRKEYIEAAKILVDLATEGTIKVKAPFVNMNKADIVGLGSMNNVPYHLTRTCYKDQPIACGKCGSCQERLEAFQLNGLVDPVKYEI